MGIFASFFQRMRQIDAGVSGYAFLGQPGEAAFPVIQGVCVNRQWRAYPEVSQHFAGNRPIVARVVTGVLVGGLRAQPLTQFDLARQTYKVPGA